MSANLSPEYMAAEDWNPCAMLAPRKGKRMHTLLAKGALKLRWAGLVLALGACASTGPAVDRSETRFKEGAPCRQSLHEVVDQINRSQNMMCQSDADCVLIANPASLEKEYRLAAHKQDAARLEEQAKKHLHRCGAFTHHKQTSAIRVVRPVCMQNHCAEKVATLETD